jgi:pyruvate/2-oxoglutarate/acetoin dehydrogenase E1 component
MDAKAAAIAAIKAELLAALSESAVEDVKPSVKSNNAVTLDPVIVACEAIDAQPITPLDKIVQMASIKKGLTCLIRPHIHAQVCIHAGIKQKRHDFSPLQSYVDAALQRYDLDSFQNAEFVSSVLETFTVWHSSINTLNKEQLGI